VDLGRRLLAAELEAQRGTVDEKARPDATVCRASESIHNGACGRRRPKVDEAVGTTPALVAYNAAPAGVEIAERNLDGRLLCPGLDSPSDKRRRFCRGPRYTVAAAASSPLMP